MRFLRSKGANDAPENADVIARLSAVTSRGKLEVSEYFGRENELPAIHRPSWSPDEVDGRHE